MHKLVLWGSASLLALSLAASAYAQKWTLSPEDATKYSTSKDESTLLKDAIAALQTAKKLTVDLKLNQHSIQLIQFFKN